MEESIKLLLKKFYEIRELGYVKTTRGGSTGIGKTFEDLLGKAEDRSTNPDYYGIEIKTKLVNSDKYTTLFNLTPKGKEQFEIKRLVKTYGYPDKTMKSCKILNATIYDSCLSCIAAKYFMGLIIDYKQRKIFLKVINMNMDLLENYVFWDFDELEERLNKKLKYLAVVNASKRYTHGIAYYHYKRIDFYYLKDFNTFLKLIEQGIICITFHIGIVKSGERKGEIHDRGTSFRIKECNLTKLFDKIPLKDLKDRRT